MSAARKKGKWIGGHPVLGYDIDPRGGRLVVNPDEADRVRAIFNLYLEHERLIPVLQELDARGWHNKQWTTAEGNIRGGKRFTKASLHGLLTNAIYTGMVNHKGEFYDGEHEAIVDQRTWKRVQAILRRNGRGNGGGTKNKYGALLRGILSCGSCGAPMVHTYTKRGAKRYRYYVCYNAQQRGWDHCETKSVSAPAIETAVLDSIRRLGRDSKLAAAVVQQATEQAEARRKELERARAAGSRPVQQLRRDLAKIAADSKLIPVDRAERLLQVQKELETAEGRLVNIAAELTALDAQTVDSEDARTVLEQFDPVWESLTTRDQERLIRLLVGKVTFDGRSGKAGVTFNGTGAKELCQENHV
jgi:site-specific DNA recombinase